jgi:hypothetical protein
MKSIKLLLALVGIAITASVSAQTYISDTENDTIAIGSQAKYKVSLYYNDINPSALFNSSGVNWTFPTGYTASDFTQINGTSALTTGTDGAYNQQEIVMKAKALATGLTLTAQELSRPLSGTGCVSTSSTTKGIVVVALPTATYGADSGSCALPTSLNVPVNFTGYGKYDVVFSVQAYNMSGTAVGSTVSRTQADLVSSRTSETTKLHYVTLLTDATGGTVFTDISTTGGYYEISITDLQDRISKKTLSYNWTSHSNEVANTNPDGALVYKFYVYPAPTTQPIQHVKNY